MASSNGPKRKASQSEPTSAPTKAQKVALKGPRPPLRDYTGDFSDTIFNQAKEYCKELQLPGKYSVSHKEFIQRLQDHYDGSKTSAGTIESTANQSESGDELIDDEPVIDDGLEPEDEPAEQSKKSTGASKAQNTKRPAPPPKPTKTVKGSSAATKKGSRPAKITTPPRSTRVLSRASHYRILELKKMLNSLRNLARIEEDPALDRFLDLLSETIVLQ